MMRRQLAGLPQGSLPRVGLSDHLQALDIGKHAGNTGAHQIVIIDHKHLYHSAPHCTEREG